MKKPACPCGKECEARTTTCKSDGTCNKYREYEEEVKRYRALVKDNRNREYLIRYVDVDRALDLKERKRR